VAGKHRAPRPKHYTGRKALTGAMVVTSTSAGVLALDSSAAAAPSAPVPVELPPSTEETPSPAADPVVGVYVVQPGDWLSRIAPRVGMTTSDLYLSNVDTIGADRDLIHPGQRLLVTKQHAGAVVETAPQPASEPLQRDVEASGFAAPLAKLFLTQRYKGQGHRGVDWAAPVGFPGYSVADGVVVESGPASGFGLWTIVRSEIGGQTVDFVYGHMDRLLVSKGQRVSAGEQIITVGNNGQSTGPHLHFEIWVGGRFAGHPVDPLAWLADHGIAVG
jgi:biotin carboxyl carrier protein